MVFSSGDLQFNDQEDLWLEGLHETQTSIDYSGSSFTLVPYFETTFTSDKTLRNKTVNHNISDDYSLEIFTTEFPFETDSTIEISTTSSTTTSVPKTTQPKTPKTELTTSKTEPMTSKTESTTSKTKPTTSIPEPTTSKTKPTTSKTEPTTSRTEHTTSKTEPTTSNTELTTSKALPTTSKPEPTTSEVPTTVIPPGTLCTTAFSCLDCNSARICQPQLNGGYAEVIRVSCPKFAPYCDFKTGSCTTVAQDECSQADEDYVCLEDGTYPDLTNSNVYHVCNNLIARKYECTLPQQHYDAAIQTCVESKRFVPFNCDGTGRKVPYNKTSSYYAYCIGNATPIVVGRCPATQKLNVTSQNCEAICERKGVLRDLSDCTKYYECDYMWINDRDKFLIRIRHSCPINTSFNPNEYACSYGFNPYC